MTSAHAPPPRNETRPPLARGGPLDALRFLAAFAIVLYHYGFEAPTPLGTVWPVFQRGYLASDFFLIVSGYVLGRTYGPRVLARGVSSGGFFLRRLRRIAPSHLAMEAVFVGWVLAGTALGHRFLHPDWYRWDQLPPQLLLVQAWGVPGGHGWNQPTWSLSALLPCYLAFPWLWRAQARVRSALGVLAIAATLLAGADLAARAGLGQPIYAVTERLGVVRALPLFILGAALARLTGVLRPPPWAAWSAVGGALVLLAAAQALGWGDAASLAFIAVAVLAAGAIATRRPSRLLERAGLASFALFLTNDFTRNVYFALTHAAQTHWSLGRGAMWALWWPAPFAAVAVAIAFHAAIDQPLQRWLRARRSRPDGAPDRPRPTLRDGRWGFSAARR